MLSKVLSGTTTGLQGILVTVEVDVYLKGFPQFRVVGLPSKSIEESKDRVKTAIKNSSFKFPEGRIIVNLAPADIPKDGSVFDLSIAIGLSITFCICFFVMPSFLLAASLIFSST